MRLWVDGELTDAGGVDPAAEPVLDVVLIGAGDTAYAGDLDELYLAEAAITSSDQARPRYCPL